MSEVQGEDLVDDDAQRGDAARRAEGQLNFVVALAPEARPIIERYRLKRTEADHPFSVFSRGHTALVVSGVGKVNAAAATLFLHQLLGGERDAAWLNVGIGGHRELPLGTAVWVHHVVDVATQKEWYPPLVVGAGDGSRRAAHAELPSSSVHTVDVPMRDYAEGVLYEMELSGQLPSAWRVATAELVQSIKLVSDNATSALDKINAKAAARYISEALPAIESLGEALRRLSADVRARTVAPLELPRFLEHWRFTVTQKRQLLDLLRRAETLALPPLFETLSDAPKSAQLLQRLHAQVAQQPLQPIRKRSEAEL